MEVGNYFRKLFNNSIRNGIYVINSNYYGPDIFLGCTKENEEYEKFRIKQDKEYISSMDQMLNKYLKESK